MKKMTKKRFIITIVSACAIAGTLTYIFLSAVAIAARARQSERYIEPDYIRYAAQGYSFDSISKKTSILLTVTQDNSPVRVQLLMFDEDKCSLDVLDIPPLTYTVADGFSGTLKKAYDTGVYKQIVSRMLAMNVNYKLEISSKGLATATELLGNTQAKVSHAVSVGDISLKKGTVTFDKSLAADIILLPNAYLTEDAVYAYHAYFSSLILKTNEEGAVDSFSKLIGLILNSVSTDMMISDIIGVGNLSNKIRLNKINIYLLPGEMTVYEGGSVYSVHSEDAAKLLNQSFRVKGFEVSESELGAPELANSGKSFSLPKQISDYIP
ncbi:MAG: hypothetical protein IJ424_04575 [Oscillospiraceae bacterium]|nr:hypothetical protein [Oscillospiraceae bacterium]